jgi:hypothetical protein
MPRRATTGGDQLEHRWRIMRITHTPARLVGHVYTAGEEAALRRAVEQFGIQKPWRNRLLAIREG